ncbi:MULTISPECIES: hypothetical protein [Sphingobacterium]|uniref:hypothetical protein n=1 Tax=Sphingobacterium TaxID=28453 RepID=UPI00257B1C96|nr:MULTISPECIES: hypothetical protein [Sphingobacterium]
MTWITFSIYLIVGYVVYYTLNILFDLLKKNKATHDEFETLNVFTEIESIETEETFHENIVVTINNSEVSNNTSGTNNRAKEDSKITIEHADEQIIPFSIQAELSGKGGISLRGLKEMYRLRAIQESNQMPFAY